jgi:large conductance mechanosensitive channel
MLDEFKQFALRGNVLDMAVGIVIGVAFGAIVSSLVDDIIMPPIGLVLGGMDFSQLFVVLSGAGDYNTIDQAKEAGAVTWNIGLFINAVVKFVIIAFALFLLVKGFNTAAPQAGRRTRSRRHAGHAAARRTAARGDPRPSGQAARLSRAHELCLAARGRSLAILAASQ